MVAPRRHQPLCLEQHGREVDGEELDLLVHMGDGHLVHPLEVRQSGVEHLEAEGGAAKAWVWLPLTGLGWGEHRFEALPVGQGPQGRIGTDQIVKMGGAGAREATDDDRSLDLEIMDLGVAGEEILDEEAVLQQLHELAVPGDHARRTETGLVA